MSVKNYLSHAVAKPLSAGLAAGAMNVVILKETDMKTNAFFGAAVGAGIFSVSWVGPFASKLMPTSTAIGRIGKALEGRIFEIACGTGAAFALKKFVLHNDFNSSTFIYKVGIIAAADLVGEKFVNYSSLFNCINILPYFSKKFIL